MLRELAQLPPTETDFLRHYHRRFFDIWEERRELDAMIRWFRGSARSPHAGLLPVDYFFYRTARKVMNRRGMPGLLRFVNDSRDILGDEKCDRLLADFRADLLPEIRRVALASRTLNESLSDLERNRRAQP